MAINTINKVPTILTNTCMKAKSALINVKNMKMIKIRPANCIIFFGLLSPIVGTPANKLLASGLLSTINKIKPPVKERFLSKNLKSHNIL